MRIINTSIKNIKNFLSNTWISELIAIILACSLVVIIFVSGMLYQQYRFSQVYPLSISQNDEVKLTWDTYLARKGNYVASRNGTKFYPIDCNSARRIGEENRVYFTSEQQAVSLGFGMSSDC